MGSYNRARRARNWLRHHGQAPIPGSGVILPDGTVSVPLMNGDTALVAFATATQTVCRPVATSPPRSVNGVAGHSRPSRDEVVAALGLLLDFLTIAETGSISRGSEESQLTIAAE